MKGIIVETEAYSQEEEACHGYHKITQSNEQLFGKPGTFYVYKSYGIHHCLNVVTDRENFASGVLIRAVFISKKNERLASGPGLVTKTYECNNCWKYNVFEYKLRSDEVIKSYKNRDWLDKKYNSELLTLQQIADICGCTPMTIRDWMIRHDLELRKPGHRHQN